MPRKSYYYGAAYQAKLRDPGFQHAELMRFIQRKYGIDADVYEAMLVDQGGVCAICQTAPEKPLRVDHDHRTGRIRGLLCHSCNIAVGWVEGDPQRLEGAREYLAARNNDDLFRNNGLRNTLSPKGDIGDVFRPVPVPPWGDRA